MKNFINLPNPEREPLVIFMHAGSIPAQYLEFCKGPLSDNFNIFIYLRPQNETWENVIIDAKNFVASLPFEKIKLFGHSLGALIAFEVSSDISNKDLEIYISGMDAPSLEQLDKYKIMARLEPHSFLNQITQLGGIPEDLQKDVKLLESFGKVIQKDFELLATITESILQKISHHNHYIMVGVNDKLTSMKTSKKWKKYFSTPSNFKLFKGGHFYLLEHKSQTQSYLIDPN